jgi:type II restriction enzyme
MSVDRIAEAKSILQQIGLARAQQNEITALTLLALAGVGPNDRWADSDAASQTLTKGIMAFTEDQYGRQYKPNTRETFRRQALHQFVQAGLALYNPDLPDLPTNSPRAHYRLTPAALALLRSFGTNAWEGTLAAFKVLAPLVPTAVGAQVELTLDGGEVLLLSPGQHNALEAAVATSFRETFAPDSTVLYLGDTADKDLYADTEALRALGVSLDEHGKLPDVVLYDGVRKWLFLIEAVTSHGPVTPKRVKELQPMFKGLDLVFVSAFPDFATFRKYVGELAWETEVWIADTPDHMIHFNGGRFLGPHK